MTRCVLREGRQLDTGRPVGYRSVWEPFYYQV
jgi:hypothetical protein